MNAVDSPGPGPGDHGPGDQEVGIREARIEDVAEIVDLLADADPAGEGGDVAPYAAAFARIAADRHQIQAVAELSGQIVGVLQLSIVPSLIARGSTSARIEGVRTLSSLRGRGIGEQLFAWALQTAAARGASVVRLTSDASLANAHRFYERLGFVGDERGFTKAL